MDESVTSPRPRQVDNASHRTTKQRPTGGLCLAAPVGRGDLEPDKAPLQGLILSPTMVRVGHIREGEPQPPADTHKGRDRLPSMAPRTA